MKYPDDNSTKLEFGTKTTNALITLSIRIDQNSPPNIGPSCLSGFDVNKNTTIYIQCSFLDWYNSLQQKGFNSLIIRQLYQFDEFAQLRQLRSKFHKQSTCILCRSFSSFTNNPVRGP
jgi:hypothetical protein